ncbi:MAG TPA: histidine phosphatase family protein [Acidimicrobiales bacterium]
MTTAPEETVSPDQIRQFRFVRPAGATSILLIRHGESAPARAGESFALVDGHGDPELAPAGREQALRVADRLAGEPIAAIYVTTLRRTAETAAPLAARLGLEPVVEADLREVFLGEWEGGLFRIRVAEGHPIAQRLLAEERWDVIPGAEPADAFAARVREALLAIAQRHPDQTVAAFTHGGVIGRALAEATGSRPLAFSGADNASISHLIIAPDPGGRWMVRAFNDSAHLHLGFTTAPEAPT